MLTVTRLAILGLVAAGTSLAACATSAQSTGYACSEIRANTEKEDKANRYYEAKITKLITGETEKQLYLTIISSGAADEVCAEAKPEDSVDDLLDAKIKEMQRLEQLPPEGGWPKTTQTKSEPVTPESEPVTPESEPVTPEPEVSTEMKRLQKQQQKADEALRKTLENADDPDPGKILEEIEQLGEGG